MLDIQKDRVFHNRTEIDFAKKSVAILAGMAWIAPAVLFFHKMFFWSILMALWFLLIVAAIPAFKKGQDWARVVLGSLSLIGAVGVGLIVLYGRFIVLQGTVPLPGDSALPKWTFLWGTVIFIIGVTLLMNRRVKKALSLWAAFK
jgi:hypothetical protein